MNKTPLLQGGIAVLLGLGIGMSVQAAEPVAKLTQIEGKVLVNKGKDYAGAQTGMPLVRGDRVLVLTGGSALVVYQDGCELRLDSNSLLTVEGKEQCTKGAVVAYAASAPGAGAAVSEVAGIPVPAIIGVAAVAGIAIGAAVISSGGGGGGHHQVAQISPE